VDVAQWLLSIGVDANAQEDDHRTPLHFAVANGRLELVQILLGHGADVNAAAGRDNRTPLHKASERGHVNIVQLLIQNGADVYARDESQSTPLHLASSKGECRNCAATDSARGGCPRTGSKPVNALASRVVQGGAETARLLIEHGADVSKPVNALASRVVQEEY
jgi:ankyrin repeat protein